MICFITHWDKIIDEKARYNCLNFIGGNIVTCLRFKVLLVVVIIIILLKVEGVVRLVKSCTKKMFLDRLLESYTCTLQYLYISSKKCFHSLFFLSLMYIYLSARTIRTLIDMY